ncbi:MAG: tetratricopeptide repeat protein [bacterium]|nr:tetratricopeptide repeat protein [bacterium]
MKFAHYKKAIQFLQKVRGNSHLYYDASYNLATAYYQILEYDDALEIIDEVLKKQDIQEELRLKLLKIKANIYESQKEYSKAISTYQTMLQYVTQKPKIYEIYYHIELLKYKRGDYKSLREVYQNYLNKYPESPFIPQLSYDLLFNYIYSEEKENAREILLFMIDKFLKNPKTLEAISLYFGSPVASLEDSTILKNLLIKNPELEDYVHLTLGRLYKRLRLYDDALKFFGLVKQGNYYNQAQVEIMEIYFLLNKYNEVEMLGTEIMPEEIREYTSYRIVELLLKALKNEGKVSTFNSLVNYFASKDFPFKKDFCLMVSDLYIREKDTTNAIKFLNIARDHGATDQEIVNYNVELLKILKENTK